MIIIIIMIIIILVAVSDKDGDCWEACEVPNWWIQDYEGRAIIAT